MSAFRQASREDIPLILRFIKDLARYEGLESEVVTDERTLSEWLFERMMAKVVFVLEGEKEVGFALYFHNFSTFLGRAGIYLEDLFIMPEYRHKGYGKALIRYLSALAVQEGCGRVEWWCLDQNKKSVDFYLSLGAECMKDWTVYRLEGKTLEKMAED